MSDHIHEFLLLWTKAEVAGHAETLATLLTGDFCGVGPLGFILSRPAWLDRHRQGLSYERFGLEEIQIRLHGDVAVVTARNTALGAYRGQPVPEALRATLVIVSDSQTPQLAAIHMSFIAGTQGSPPLPALAESAQSETNPDREAR